MMAFKECIIQRDNKTQWQIGDIKITRIVELVVWGNNAFVLPDAENELCKAFNWMNPHFMNDDGDFRMVSSGEPGLTILLDNRRLSYFRPASQTVQEYSLSKHKDRIEPFVRLGFSETGKDLEDDFLVTFIGDSAAASPRGSPARSSTRRRCGSVWGSWPEDSPED